MILRELLLENFGPYLGKNIIKLIPENREELTPPIILVGGMNGGGKTTLMDAIRLTLYGPRAQCSTRGNLGYNDFLLQCINSKTPLGENTRIELEFEQIIDEQLCIFRVVRYWDKTVREGKDNLGVTKQDWVDKHLVETWDEYIENLLPLGISNLFLFDGEQVKELADQEVPTPDVMTAIKSLLGLELVERLDEDLELLNTRKRRDLGKSKSLQSMEELEDQLEIFKQKKDHGDQEIKILKEKLQNLQAEESLIWANFQLESGKFAQDKSNLKAKKQQLEKQIDHQREVMAKLASRSLPLALITPLLNQAKIQGEKEIKSQQAQVAQQVLKERDAKLLAYLNHIALNHHDLRKIEDFLTQENESLSHDIEEVKEYWLNISPLEIKQLEIILDHQLPLQINQAEADQKKLQELEKELEDTERKLMALTSPQIYQNLQADLDEVKKQIAQVKLELENALKSQQELSQKIKDTNDQLTSYTEELLKRENKEHILHSIAKVRATLTKFRERLTLNKLNKLEMEVTSCFRYLLHKSSLVHRVMIHHRDYSLTLYDNEGKLLPKHRLSAGEKQLLAIALLWGLARVSRRHLPVAIDTPLGRLDSSHRHNLVERYFPCASHQVILFSTDTEIDQNLLTFLRKNEAIALEYLLEYDQEQKQTRIKKGYFW